MLLCNNYVQGGTDSVVFIWCSAHVGHVVLCTDDIMYMLDMQCYVNVVLCACRTCGVIFIWWCVHDFTSGVVCMQCCVHVLQVALCASGALYISCMWNCVQVVSCTCPVCGTMYMCYCVHIVQVVQCTCGIVNTLCRWCNLHVMLCTHCEGGCGVQVVLCTCGTYGTRCTCVIMCISCMLFCVHAVLCMCIM